MQFTPYAVPMLIAAALLCGLGGYSLIYRKVPAALPFSIRMFLCAAWAVIYTLDITSYEYNLKLIWAETRYLAITPIPAIYLVLAMRYTGHAHWPDKRTLATLLIIPAITVILSFTGRYHHLFHYDFSLDMAHPFPVLLFKDGVWNWILDAYSFALLAASWIVLIHSVRGAPPYYRRQVPLLVIATLLPSMSEVLYEFKITPIEGYNLSPTLFVLMGGLFAWVLFRQQLLKVAPIARSAVIESMSDIMLVLDPLDHLVDFNPSAVKILGTERLQIGQSLKWVLAEWNEFLQLYLNESLTTGEFSAAHGAPPAVYEFSTTVVQDKRGNSTGRLLLFRDITSRKRDEEKLRTSEQRFRLMVHVAPTPLMLTRVGDNIILYVNEKAAELFGTPSNDLIGHSALDLYLSPAERMKLAEEVMENTAVYDHEMQLKRHNGDHFWGLVSAAVTAYQNEIVFLVGIVDISQRKQLEQAEAHARQVTEALQQIGMVINSTLDFSEMSDRILVAIAQVIQCDLDSILLREGSDAVLTAVRGYENTQELIGRRFSLVNESPNRLVIEQQRPVIVPDIQADFPSFFQPQSKSIKSWMGIPLFSKGVIIGFLNLDSYELNHFSEEDQSMAEGFANQVVIGLENVRLYAAAQQRVKELSVLNEITQSVSSKLDINELLNLVYQQVNRFIDARFFMIVASLPEQDAYVALYFRRDDQMLEKTTRKTSQGFTGYVLQTRQPLFLKNSAEVESFIKDSGRESLISMPKSIILVPLTVSERIIGVMGVQNDAKEDAYTAEDFILFTSIAAQVAVALENANLYAKMERLAMIDGLTDIFNRRHFFVLAEIEFDRAVRYHRPLAVIMLDIDNFKQVNDTYGHQVGDQVLQRVAKTCKQLIRKVDFIGRYGGEEFTVLLPETKGEHAFNAAERLRKAIAATGVVTPQGRVTVTVSVGVSTMENEGTSLESLLASADRALYTAKQAGRNQVHLFRP